MHRRVVWPRPGEQGELPQLQAGQPRHPGTACLRLQQCSCPQPKLDPAQLFRLEKDSWMGPLVDPWLGSRMEAWRPSARAALEMNSTELWLSLVV